MNGHRTLTLSIVLAASSVATAAEPEANRTSLPAAPPPSVELQRRPASSLQSSAMHPRILLRDARARLIRESSEPIDMKATCGTCHDVGWITSHGFHFGGSALAPSVILSGDSPTTMVANCIVCHVRHANVESARAALAAGDARWVATATLLGGGLVVKNPDTPASRGSFAYVMEALASDGSVSGDQLQLGPPSNEACGACHGLVTRHSPKLEDWLTRPSLTEQTGQVFSPERVNQSTMNIEGRDATARSWDVHAERLLSCSDCHYSQNDPRSRALSPKIPNTLRLEPRHAGLSAFLRRPSHDFARGGAQLRCENCHESRRLHDFLPHVERHLARLSCEVCHVPRNLVPALREVDWSLPLSPGQPRLAYRGIEGALSDPSAFVSGVEPAIIFRRDVTGNSKLAPVNFITTWTWRQGSSRGAPIEQAILNRALFDSRGQYNKDLLRVLDRNHDGQLEASERWLDSKERVNAVVQLLLLAGAKDPKLVGEVRAVPIHHGIVSGRFAVRDCTQCHSKDSRLKSQVELAAHTPPEAQLVYLGDSAEVSLLIQTKGSSAVARLDGTQRSNYVLGSSRSLTIDAAGLSFASLALLGVLAHGGLRIRGYYRRRRAR